ncbi:MAG: zinc ribbon domain-containing protein [Deltaproteobacteria bacterium]|nr:zinc ribbon domain-containing protein [Deltaproteobacteria bacterium]
MKCPKCQFENPEEMKFCGECGGKLEIQCSKCNASNPPQFKFCGECGNALTKAAAPSPVNYEQPQSYIHPETPGRENPYQPKRHRGRTETGMWHLFLWSILMPRLKMFEGLAGVRK